MTKLLFAIAFVTALSSSAIAAPQGSNTCARQHEYDVSINRTQLMHPNESKISEPAKIQGDAGIAR